MPSSFLNMRGHENESLPQNRLTQAALKDFQATMKAAKAKEAASLPKQPGLPQGRAVPDLERGEAEGATEQQALLQVGSALVPVDETRASEYQRCPRILLSRPLNMS